MPCLRLKIVKGNHTLFSGTNRRGSACKRYKESGNLKFSIFLTNPEKSTLA